MIITTGVTLKIMSKNIVHFKNLGYDIKYGDIIDVSVEDLLKTSYAKIEVKCDICGSEKYKPYCHYNKLISNQNFYSCQKCKTIKRKKTMIERYGVEHALQNKDVMNKVKNTMIERHGSYCSTYSDEIKDKTKKTIFDKYGVEYITQTEEFKETSKKTKLKKYGDENFVNHQKTKITKLEKYGDENYRNDEKRNLTILNRYGVKHISQNEEIKKKKIETSLEHYGFEHPLQSKIVMDKIKQTNMEKFGVPHPMMNDEVKEKSYLKCVEDGRWTPREQQSDFYKYSLLVYGLTRKNTKEIYNNWDGKDYYTGNYIKENLLLDSNDKEYPTIDHKISTKYGFDNNIDPVNIASIDNICITTRSNNSSKNINCK